MMPELEVPDRCEVNVFGDERSDSFVCQSEEGGAEDIGSGEVAKAVEGKA